MASMELLRSGYLMLSSTLPKVVNRLLNPLRLILSPCLSSSSVVKSRKSSELLRSEPPLFSFTLPDSSARTPGFPHLRVNLLTALPPPPPEPPDPPDSQSCLQPLFFPPTCTPLSVLESSTKPSPEVVNFVSILSISPSPTLSDNRPTEINELPLSLWFPPPLHSLHRLVPPFVRILELSLASAPAIYQKIKLLLWLPSSSFFGRVMRLCADESFVGIIPKASLSVVLNRSNKSLGFPVWACFGCWLMCVGFVPLPPMVFCGSKEKRVYIPFGLKKTLQLTSHERERCLSTIMGSPHDFSVNFLTAMSSCVLSTPSEEATGLVSTIFGGRSCFTTSPCNVTIDYSLAVKAFSTHLNFVSSSLSIFYEDEFALCLLLSLCFIVLLQRGCLIPSPTCNRAV